MRRKNISQAAKGKIRARRAKRDEKGRFIKENIPAGSSSRNIQPIVTTITTNDMKEEKK